MSTARSVSHRPAACRNGRQRGVAVITALLLTTLAVTIVASLFWQQQVQVRSIENQRLQLQKEWILRGALDWARLIIREDGKYSATDTLDEPWAVPLSDTKLNQYVEEGQSDADAADASLSGGIVDAQSRYNLTNLAPNGVINPLEVTVFERLLTALRLDPALAKGTADMIASSSQRSPGAALTNGSTTGGSTGSTTGGATTGTTAGTTGAVASGAPTTLPLTQVDDLLAVPGFAPQAVDKLRDFVIFLPRVTPVNVNTAPAEVLAARIASMSTGDAAVLVAARKSAAFRDLTDLAQRMPGKSVSASSSELSVATSFFLVNGNVKMRRAGLQVQALVERTGATTRLVWVREY
jgi:general secretion pathway protein K